MDLGKGPKMRSAPYAVDQIDPAAIQPERPLHHKEYRNTTVGMARSPGWGGVIVGRTPGHPGDLAISTVVYPHFL